MNIGLIYIIILCIWNSILFFGNSFGVNVILFTIPLLIYLYYIFKINKLIKNKKGLLFSIPIILLSLHYMIFDNVLNNLNIIVIPCLYVLMYIYTMKPTSNIVVLLDNLVRIFIMPLDYIEKLFKIVIDYFSKVFHLTDNSKRIIKSILIVIPIVLIVILLLSSADRIFYNLFHGILKIFNNISIPDLIGRIAVMIILFIYIGISMYYLINKYQDNEDINYKNINIDEYTVKILLTVLNIIYIVFDIIQIRSLLLHRVSNNIIYSEYAREGFFQLMIISFINIIIILLSKNSKKNNYNKLMSIFMLSLTLVIIISSIYRMYMYECAYGYTVLRLGVYTILFSEIILLIPTIIYIIKDKYDVLKYYMIICLCIYTSINLVPINSIIARKNIDRYYEKNKIDLEYLKDYKYENVAILKELYLKTEEKEIKEDLDEYFNNLKENKDNIFEYNIYKSKALKILK